MWIYLTELASYAKTRILKFRKLFSGYREQGHSWWKSLYYSIRLVYKRKKLEDYSKSSCVREKNVIFMKTVIGGSVELIPYKLRSGPKPVLEYAYIDDVRKDKLFHLLSGPNRDFSGNSEVLFLFGSMIRYKYMNQPEITIRSDRGTVAAQDLEKKNLSMCLPYD
jgi:hypothetical protein